MSLSLCVMQLGNPQLVFINVWTRASSSAQDRVSYITHLNQNLTEVACRCTVWQASTQQSSLSRDENQFLSIRATINHVQKSTPCKWVSTTRIPTVSPVGGRRSGFAIL